MVIPLCLFLFLGGSAMADPFRPALETMSVGEVRTGMRGEARTVIDGEAIRTFPVEVVSILQRRGTPRNLILIRAEGALIEKTGGIAAGMSGSPVFIDGRLVGAIGYGWNFSDHRLGLVTPIEDMSDAWDWPLSSTKLPDPVAIADPSEKDNLLEEVLLSPDLGPADVSPEAKVILVADGLSPRAEKALESRLGVTLNPLGSGGGSPYLPVETDWHPQPGAAVGVQLAWGDVSLGATGTLTAVDGSGRFVAFAHPFLNRGPVAYPLVRSMVHAVVPSLESPFKLGEALAIVGTVTQDRPQAIGGRLGYFAPSVSVTVTFRDVDMKREKTRRFHVVNDPFIFSSVVPDALLGMVDDLWGRLGEGTIRSTVHLEGRNLQRGWTRKNMFFSGSDVVAAAVSDVRFLTDLVALNPFLEVFPLGLKWDLEITRDPRVLLIEDVTVKEKEVAPGGKVEVTVKLRPYRKAQESRTFTLNVPDEASGTGEIVVRGGGIAEPEQESLLAGWRSITDLGQLLTEVNAKESNNEVIVELLLPPKDPLAGAEEEQKLLSELKKEKLREGTLRIFRSNFYVEGLMRRLVTIKGETP